MNTPADSLGCVVFRYTVLVVINLKKKPAVYLGEGFFTNVNGSGARRKR